jgi:hypothetical protein
MIKNVVTTNWDDFFERECDFDAFVNDSDMALWEASDRRLMKIHGSIRNLGSIVATHKDYKDSLRRLNYGPMGAQLKALLTQKTFIYTGYSLSDENYRQIIGTIARMTRPHTKHSYFVSPNIDRTKIEKLPIPLIPIETDGAYFFEQIRLHLEHLSRLVPERAFEACENILVRIRDEHIRTADAFLNTRHPLLIFTLSYQDGLIHGLQRIIDRRKIGEYHCFGHLQNLVRGYDQKTVNYKRKRDFWNSYYSEGYGDAILLLLIASSEKKLKGPPIFGHHGNIDFGSLSSILRFPRRLINKSHLLVAKRIIRRLSGGAQFLIPDHMPYV